MAKTKQPSWEFIENLGDKSPLDYGGYFIYRDKTGVYPEEAQVLLLNEPEDTYTIYRFPLERLKLVDGFLVPYEYSFSLWPHPVEQYDEWFHNKLDSVATYVDTDLKVLEKAFTSDDPLVRANAYRAIGDYFGWEELDQYPDRELSRREVKKRFPEISKAR